MKSWQTGSDARDTSSSRITTMMVILTVVLAIVGILLFIYLAFAAGNALYDHFNPAPAGYDRSGNILIDTNKLSRTDSIVAIWQSHDGSFDGWAGLTNNYLLVFYDDNTYAFYDRANSSCKKGTWIKKEDVYTDHYTLSEGTLTPHPETVNGVPARGAFQLVLYEEGTPPNARIAYIDFTLVDYSPLKPDTITKLNHVT